ncbi:MAG: hypothetical protein A2097_07710 [Desulfobacula sp. GWF2_41_7]|nr:MAG: hypothetical protein A2097_07710 [Desulfobacula sp. GWF2_41_7]
MTNRLAIFDFDGTITRRDSFFPFLVFCFGYYQVFRVGITMLPVLIMYKLKLISNSKAKEIVFENFFKGMPQKDFNQLCRRYSLKKISPMVRIKALEKIIRHKTGGDKVIVISASVENWIRPWADSQGIDEVIGTTVEIKDRVLTGKFKMPNCHGKEKVRRLVETYKNLDSYYIFAYGDSRGDKELLAISNESFYRLF